MPEISITARQKFFIGINIRPLDHSPFDQEHLSCMYSFLIGSKVAELAFEHSFAFRKGGNITREEVIIQA